MPNLEPLTKRTKLKSKSIRLISKPSSLLELLLTYDPNKILTKLLEAKERALSPEDEEPVIPQPNSMPKKKIVLV